MNHSVKKTICALLACIVPFTFAGCAKKRADGGPGGHAAAVEIASEIYEELKAYYTGGTLFSYLEAAALYKAGFDPADCDWSRLASPPGAGMEARGRYLLSVYFLDAAGCDMSAYETEKHLAYLEEGIQDPRNISTVTLGECILALSLYQRDFDAVSAADQLLSRQNEISGALYDFPPAGGEQATENPVAAAFALTAYQAIKPTLQSGKYNDALNDGIMLYLFYGIDENNTVKDKHGKSSALATALCLSALVAAGMTPEGDNALCLLDALGGFALGKNGGFRGYGRYASQEEADSEATAGVLFAAVTVLYGNPFSLPEA